MSTADSDAYIRGLTKLIANDRVWRPARQAGKQEGRQAGRSCVVNWSEMSTTGDPHLYSRSREIGRKYGRTSNSEKRARAMMATQFALPITWRRQDQSEISRIDTTTKYNAYFSISRRWQLPALPSRCCRPREWQSAKRKKSRNKITLRSR